jgi:hypothetical protein
MTYGSCRVTVLDAEGRPYVAIVVKAVDLWYSLQARRTRCRGSDPMVANS